VSRFNKSILKNFHNKSVNSFSSIIGRKTKHLKNTVIPKSANAVSSDTHKLIAKPVIIKKTGTMSFVPLNLLQENLYQGKEAEREIVIMACTQNIFWKVLKCKAP
jgi:hypothetical protein